DHRERDVVRMLGTPAVHGGEVGRVDAVEREDLLGERLVLRQVETVRAGAGELAAEQLEKGGDVRVVAVLARKRLDQVEDQVGLRLRELDQALRGAVEAKEDGTVAGL